MDTTRRKRDPYSVDEGRNFFFAGIIKLTSTDVARQPFAAAVAFGAAGPASPEGPAIIVNVKFNVCARPMQSIRYCS